MTFDREYYSKAFPLFDESVIDVIVAYQKEQDTKEKGAPIVEDVDGSEITADQQPGRTDHPGRSASVSLPPDYVPEALDDVCGCKEYPNSV